MKTFKQIAKIILQENNQAMHSKEITQLAITKNLLQTYGKTPAATMNAQLITDINAKQEKSCFIKTAPSTFSLNPLYKEESTIIQKKDTVINKTINIKKKFAISKNVSSKQKGDIAEARIAELVTLYGETTLSCYKPISDDDGIDLIVKEKGNLNTMYIQIKSRFGYNQNIQFSAKVRKKKVIDKYSMILVFCFFDLSIGDLANQLWFVPAPDFLKMTQSSKPKHENNLLFTGNMDNSTNKWHEYLIDKKFIANKIMQQISRI